jgi:hypothetical protein
VRKRPLPSCCDPIVSLTKQEICERPFIWRNSVTSANKNVKETQTQREEEKRRNGKEGERERESLACFRRDGRTHPRGHVKTSVDALDAYGWRETRPNAMVPNCAFLEFAILSLDCSESKVNYCVK